MDKVNQSVIESCRESARLCKACAAAAVSNGEKEDCEKPCLDCAAICELCVTLGESESPFFKQAVELCIDACMNCVAVCEENGCEICMKCAFQCRICTVDCFNIVE